jgi:hypothetical protein
VVHLGVVVGRHPRGHRHDTLAAPGPSSPRTYTGPQRRRRASPRASQKGASHRSNSRSHAAVPTIAPSAPPATLARSGAHGADQGARRCG